MDKIVGRRIRSRRQSVVDGAPAPGSIDGSDASARLLEALGGGLAPRTEQGFGLCMDTVFNLLRHSILFLDARMNILWLNDAARELLLAGDILSRSSNRLRATDPTETPRLRQFVGETIAAKSGHGDRPIMSLRRASTGRYVELVAARCLWADACLGVAAADPVAVVLISDPQQPTTVPDPVLESLFGLTVCERRLARALLNGESLDAFSDAAHVSINTSRSHLKSIFRKTGTSSQAALVTLLSRLVPPVTIDSDDT